MAGNRTVSGVSHTWSWPLSDWDRMWRPSMWLSRPPDPHPAHLWHLVAILGIVIYANVIVNEVLSPPFYVPFNLGVLTVVVLIARRAGTTWTAMGLRADRAGRGLRVGAILGFAVVGAIVVATASGVAGELVEDDRIVEGSFGLALYHGLFRIPLGTALYEEVLFRGVVFGMLVRRYTPLTAALWSALLFGVWHVLPALDAIDYNQFGEVLTGVGGTSLAIVGAVLSTFVVGLVFQWIRLYANSIVAPVIVHVASNTTAILAAAASVHL